MIAMVSVSVMSAVAQPAEPVSGMRWVIDAATSDEFEADKFNHDKWYNSDPKSWRGRFPALFTPESMSQSDGKLHITCDKFDKPVAYKGQQWTHRGGHIYSKSELTVGAYAECKMKANKTFMSSTFWLITGRSNRTECDRRTTELDIQECIGFPDKHKKTSQMGSNTHSRGIPKGCDVPAGSKGDFCEMPDKAYKNYHTYAAWWKSPREILFYLDGEYKYTVNPVADFNLPMAVKMVCETYNWSKPPQDGGMTGTWEERTTSYEWVRCYNSIPVGRKQGAAGNAANSILSESVKFASDAAETLSATAPMLGVVYSSAKGGAMSMQLKDSNGKSVATAKAKLYSGVGNTPVKIKGGKLAAGKYTATVKFGDEKYTESFEVK